jgi:DNA-directed RNA polymerase
MIGIDATQSGLQVLAGLVRDAITAALTNVLGAAKPADAYKRVADRANELLIERGRPDLAILTRGDVKRVTMTIPYNATRYSNFEYIRQALPELFPYIPGITKEQKDKQKENVIAIVNAVRGNGKDLIGAMQEIVPGALETMKWLNAQVSYWLREGATMLNWRSPSGFITTQILMQPDIVRMELKLYGCARKVNLKSKDSDIVDKAAHQSATAPNLIHSLDAALLHIALADAENFSIIHDCILCRATEVFTVQKRIREAYKQCFSGDIIFLEEWAKKMKAETMPHIFDTFDPADVVESLYFYN